MANGMIMHEVGLRDGLQMEKQVVSTAQKIAWAEPLIDSGIDILQLGSFVHPEKIPQMADTDDLFRHFKSIQKTRPVVVSGLVLNEKGLERGLACGVEMFCMGVSASETHSRKNTGMSVSEATDRILRMAGAALEAKKKIQVSVQSAFGCGYEGHVPQEEVMKIVRRYLEEGLKNISLADTAGRATPDQVERMYGTIRTMDPDVKLSCHFHNTYGLALANCYAAMKTGVKSFESSVAGLGGCPFTKIAGGNVCTEDLVHMWQRMGLRRDISLEKLIDLACDMSKFFGRELPGTIYRTGPIHEPGPIPLKDW
jgi:hydroxymethylglutaryl-CoA lyase